MASKNKDMMAREVVARKGSKRVELSGPQADGRWVVTVMQEEKQVVPGEANDRFVESKFYSTEAGARRAASKILASRPGAKDMMAAGDMTTPEAIAKMMEAWNKIEAQAKKQFPNASKEELYRITKSAMESALKFKFSRPGAKATFRVEDRFYFGKGRKERFADDAKQIADTILKQLGGGRFIAMTGAKNLAFMSNPPGLHMSIGRGTKDGIKYLRVNYDRGSDTYNMIFANKSGSTVKSVNHVYADSLQRVFTSTTGFDTHL